MKSGQESQRSWRPFAQPPWHEQQSAGQSLLLPVLRGVPLVYRLRVPEYPSWCTCSCFMGDRQPPYDEQLCKNSAEHMQCLLCWPHIASCLLDALNNVVSLLYKGGLIMYCIIQFILHHFMHKTFILATGIFTWRSPSSIKTRGQATSLKELHNSIKPFRVTSSELQFIVTLIHSFAAQCNT